MLRTILAGPIIAFGLVWPLDAGADQNDPRLDALFRTLKTAEAGSEVKEAEGRIWSIWMDSDNPVHARMMRMGVEQMSSGRLPQALETYTKLIEDAPGFAEAWNKRATIHFMMGDLAESVADVAQTLRLEPRHFGALSGLGRIELRRGDPEGALEAFRAALKVHPHLPGAAAAVERLSRKLEREI